jgi:hypothetical protein
MSFFEWNKWFLNTATADGNPKKYSYGSLSDGH